YPKVTSADTNASGLLSQIGLPPTVLGGYEGHTFLVARTLPIRVAGESGFLLDELSWDQIPADKPERTTVTNKVRRIGKWDQDLWDKSLKRNEPCGVFLSFAD